MNYEEKYKQALERARECYRKSIEQGWTCDKEIYEQIFPELRESEDEKIRKELIERFKWELKCAEEQDAAGCSRQKDIAMFKQGIAWLEKQGEQKPIMIQWTGDNLKELVHFTGKSPKFEEWFKTWEDFENYVHTHNDIFKLFNEDGSHFEVPVGAWIFKTPDGYNIPSCFKFIQKPSWSEEDEEKLNSIIEVLGDNSLLVQWLKSLKPNHWKPSEEQMEALFEAKLASIKNREYFLGLLYEDLKKL